MSGLILATTEVRWVIIESSSRVSELSICTLKEKSSDRSCESLRVNSFAGRNFWPGQNFWPQAKISAWNSGLEKTSPKFWPEISGQNCKPKFQAEISVQKMCLLLCSPACLMQTLALSATALVILASNLIKKPGKSRLLMTFWLGIFWLEIYAWNYGLEFRPRILAWKNQVRNFGLKNRPEFQARNFGLKCCFGSQMNRP